MQSRLRKAAEASGLDAGRTDRQLFVLRNAPWPNGKETEEETARLAAKGGVVLPASPADLAVFAALAVLEAEHHPALNAWLADRKPAHATEMLTAALATWPSRRGAVRPGRGRLARPEPAAPARREPRFGHRRSAGSRAGCHRRADGHRAGRGRARPRVRPGSGSACPPAGPGADLELASLRRHLAIFAGSGSGKTVLLRRVIEECALQGVSSIVLDPNNDLARLGDAWPSAPGQWLAGDDERARRYLAETDVVIWTPRRAGGRPLTFQPLPDFGAVIDETDEFNAAVDVAVEALAPGSGRSGRAGGPPRRRRCSPRRCATSPAARGHDLGAFIDLLGDLPEHVSQQSRAAQIAADLADRLRPCGRPTRCSAGPGAAADPGLLLTPPPGKRARISVISMVGMASLGQWQGFVNQLQMALFSWIKRNPAEDEPLGGAAGHGRGAGPGARAGHDPLQRVDQAAGLPGAQVRARPALRHPVAQGAAQLHPRQRRHPVLRPAQRPGPDRGGARASPGRRAATCPPSAACRPASSTSPPRAAASAGSAPRCA